MSHSVRAAVVLLCSQNRFTRESFRTLVWVSRGRHVTFIVGKWPPWSSEGACLDIARCLWKIGWYYAPTSAEWAHSLFSYMQRVVVPSRIDLHNVLKEMSFSPPLDVAEQLAIRATHSRYPWERSSDVQMIEAQSWHHQRKHEVGDPRL